MFTATCRFFQCSHFHFSLVLSKILLMQRVGTV